LLFEFWGKRSARGVGVKIIWAGKKKRGGEGGNYVGLSASTKVDADSLNFF
jgi:hypothetical protein